MALPTYDQRLLIRDPFSSHRSANSVPTVAQDFYDQEFPAYGRYNANLTFKNLFDFARYDDGTLYRADGLATPVDLVPSYASFVFAGDPRGIMGVGDEVTITASALNGKTVIVDDSGADVVTLCTADLLSGSYYLKKIDGTNYDFSGFISGRSVFDPAAVSSPFRSYYTTVILPATGVQLTASTLARWSSSHVTGYDFSENVAPTIYSTPNGDDLYILRLLLSCTAEDVGSGPDTMTLDASVMGLSGSYVGTWDGTYLGGDGNESSTQILTSISWPPGDMSVSGTVDGYAGYFYASAELYRVRVALYNNGYWNYSI